MVDEMKYYLQGTEVTWAESQHSFSVPFLPQGKILSQTGGPGETSPQDRLLW